MTSRRCAQDELNSAIFVGDGVQFAVLEPLDRVRFEVEPAPQSLQNVVAWSGSPNSRTRRGASGSSGQAILSPDVGSSMGWPVTRWMTVRAWGVIVSICLDASWVACANGLSGGSSSIQTSRSSVDNHRRRSARTPIEHRHEPAI